MHIVDEKLISEARDILGDKFSNLIERYIEDSYDMLATIDVLRAAQNVSDIIGYVHSLKSSSHYVGAMQVSRQANIIENFLTDNANKIDNLPNQTRLDSMIQNLRQQFILYEDHIKIYCPKKMLGN